MCCFHGGVALTWLYGAHFKSTVSVTCSVFSDTVPPVKFVSSEAELLMVRAVVVNRQMTAVLAACRLCTDDVLSEWVEEGGDQDNCSQLRSSDLKKK